MASFTALIPLIILFVLVGVGGFIGYHMYVWSNELADRANKKMEKKNMSFTKEGGLRVGVKEMKSESYADKTQNVLVNVWNNASFPNYKSSLGWNSTQADPKKQGHSSIGNAPPRPSASRSNSGQTSARQGRTAASTSGSTLSPPAYQGSQRRSASPVPGGWE